jgi:hypothetical protein
MIANQGLQIIVCLSCAVMLGYLFPSGLADYGVVCVLHLSLTFCNLTPLVVAGCALGKHQEVGCCASNICVDRLVLLSEQC